MYAQLPRMTLAVRGLGHLAQVVRIWPRTRWRAVLVGAGSIAGDVFLAAAQRRARQPGTLGRSALDAADTAGWVGGGADPLYVLGPGFNGVEMSRGVEQGFFEMVGPGGTPPILRSRALPISPVGWLGLAGRLAAPMAATIGVLLAARRVRPRDVPAVAIGGVVTIGFGAYLAQLRNREQRQARDLWSHRVRNEVDRSRFAARYQAATEQHDGHNFKRVLYALGPHSPACFHAARQAAARPAQVRAAGTDGLTLAEAARYHDIDPPGAGATWLSPEQAHQLRRVIEDGEARPVSPDPWLRVVGRHGNDVEVAYFGHETWLRATAPKLEANLDPIAAGLAAISAYRLSYIHPAAGGFRPRTALTILGIDSVLFLAVAGTPAASDRPVRPILLAAAASSLAWYAATIRGHAAEVTSLGQPTNPGMAGASVLGVIVYYWDELGGLAWPLVAVIYGGLLAVLLTRRSATSRAFIVSELLVAAQFCAGFAGMRRRLAEERDLLAEQLAERFAAESEAARQEEQTRELDRIAGLVDLAETELDRLLGDPEVSLDDADVVLWRNEMAKVRAWVNSRAS